MSGAAVPGAPGAAAPLAQAVDERPRGDDEARAHAEALTAERDRALAQVEALAAERDRALAQVEALAAERDHALGRVASAEHTDAGLQARLTQAEETQLRQGDEIAALKVARTELAQALAASESERARLDAERARLEAALADRAAFPSAATEARGSHTRLGEEFAPALSDLALRIRALERFATSVLPPRAEQVAAAAKAAARQLERLERIAAASQQVP